MGENVDGVDAHNTDHSMPSRYLDMCTALFSRACLHYNPRFSSKAITHHDSVSVKVILLASLYVTQCGEMEGCYESIQARAELVSRWSLSCVRRKPESISAPGCRSSRNQVIYRVRYRDPSTEVCWERMKCRVSACVVLSTERHRPRICSMGAGRMKGLYLLPNLLSQIPNQSELG